MVHETSGVRHSLQLADYLIQCGDRARAAEIYLRLAAAYADHRRTPEAAAILYRALHVDSSQFVAVAVADTLRRLGHAGVAICRQAAEMHRLAGRYGDSLRMVQLASDLDPSDALAPVRLAEVLLEQHDYKQAVVALSEAGRRLLRDGNNADFLAVGEQILSIDPGHADTLRELARTHVRLGEPRRAVDLLARLMRVMPEDVGGYEILAQAFASIGRMPKALSILTRLVHDRRRAGDEPGALGMLDRALAWSHEDGLRRTLAALRTPPAARPGRAAVPAREATVMLSIHDIAIEEERDLEGTLVIALDDIAFVEASRHRARRPAVPPRRTGRKGPPPPPPSAATIVLDLSDLVEEDCETAIDHPIRDSEMRRLAALAVDEDSGAREIEHDEAPTAVRKSPLSSQPQAPRPTPTPAPALARKDRLPAPSRLPER